jgi:hypothetical protein
VLADLTARTCAGPGVYVGPDGSRLHVSAIEAGVVVNGEDEPTVVVMVAVTVRSAPEPVLN